MTDWRELDEEVQEQIRSLEQLRARLATAGGAPTSDAQEAAAEAVGNLEGQFLELLSHEIRTPLTSTIGYLDLMLAGDAGEITGEQHHCVAVARRSASRVLALITDLVVVARAEAGWLTFAPQPVDVVPAIALAAVAADAATADVAVLTHLPATLELPADPEALNHVMTSLIGRAVRHARPGGQVDVKLGQNEAQAVIEISHSGRPLPDVEGSALGEIMLREPRAVADAVDGGGLELASAKAIIDAFGGRLSGEGDPFDGTRLAVTLPLADHGSWSNTPANGGPGSA